MRAMRTRVGPLYRGRHFKRPHSRVGSRHSGSKASVSGEGVGSRVEEGRQQIVKVATGLRIKGRNVSAGLRWPIRKQTRELCDGVQNTAPGIEHEGGLPVGSWVIQLGDLRIRRICFATRHYM